MQILIFAVNHHVYNALTYDTPFNNLVQHGGRSTNTKASVETLIGLLMEPVDRTARQALVSAADAAS